MAETLELTTPRVTSYRVKSILFIYMPPSGSQLEVVYLGNDGVTEIRHVIVDTAANSDRATTLIRQLNKANLSAGNSLNQRAIQLGIDDGILPAGTPGGTTD